MEFGHVLAMADMAFRPFGFADEGAVPMLVFFIGAFAIAGAAIWYANHRRFADGTAASMPSPYLPRNGAEEIARQRLARSEITAEEYERILAVLRQ